MSSCLLGEDGKWGYLISYLFAAVMSVKIVCINVKLQVEVPLTKKTLGISY